MLTVKVKKLDQDLPNPSYSYVGDAGFDLYTRKDFTLKPGEFGRVPTGFAFEPPPGYAVLVWDKSGIAMKRGVKTLGGVSDPGYRGEVIVGLVNLSPETQSFQKGNKIAQALIQKIENVTFEIVEELSATERGDRGFGSSGK